MLMEQLYCTCTEGHLVVCVSVSPFLNLVLASFSYQTFFSFVFWFCFFYMLSVIISLFSLWYLLPLSDLFLACPRFCRVSRVTPPILLYPRLPYSSETLFSLPPDPAFLHHIRQYLFSRCSSALRFSGSQILLSFFIL